MQIAVIATNSRRRRRRPAGVFAFGDTVLLCVVVFAAVLVVGVNALAIPQPPPLADFAKSISDVASGMIRNLPNVFPSPVDLFSASKNIVAGYPAEAVLNAVNLFCSSAISTKSVQPKAIPDIDSMNFILMTRQQNYSIPLRNVHDLWHHAAFNASRPLAVLVTGWTSNINKSNNALSLVYEAYMCRGGVNFVAIDTAQYVDTLYEWSAFNTEEIGKHLANALKDLTDHSYPIANIHLIGHSLGAHIVGSAGRKYNELTGNWLPRITGLDPANPCFNEGQTLTGLSRGDADYVVVVHSNPGALGKREPLGDVDFYPNGKMEPLPPGCMSIGCAHGRAYEYYAESVYPGNENAFMAVKCHSMFALNAGFCRGVKQPMGYATPNKLKGDYFLRTKSESPYGAESSETTKPADVKCNEEDGTIG